MINNTSHDHKNNKQGRQQQHIAINKSHNNGNQERTQQRVEIQCILGALETIRDLLPTCIHQQGKGHRHIQFQHAKHIGLDGSA